MSAYWKLLPLVAAITLTACGGGGSSGGGVNADAGGGNVETPNGPGDGGEGDGDPDDGGGDETVGNPPAAVRFIVIGDSGSGSAGQYAVGQAIADVCDGKDEFVGDMAFAGCDLVVGLGDNIYELSLIHISEPTRPY